MQILLRKQSTLDTLCIPKFPNESNTGLNMHASPFQPDSENKGQIPSGNQINSENFKNMALSYPRESCNVETGSRYNEKVSSKEFSPIVVAKVRCNNGTMGKSQLILSSTLVVTLH